MTRHQLRDLNFLGWILCAAMLVIVLNEVGSRIELRDFVYFYSFGEILNRYTSEHLYQIALQQETFSRVLPLKDGFYGPNAYPPYVAVFFRPFALLPFWTAYRVWISMCMVMYLAGLLPLVRRFWPADNMRQSILCCLGLLYWPFIARTFLNGQLSTIGFLGIASAICLEDADHRYFSGVALAVCGYKPTLLLLILPMLLVTRRKQMLVGFIGGVALLLTATTLLEGVGIWPGYLRMTAEYARRQALLLCDYVDLLAFSTSISHGASILIWTLRAFGLVAAAFLVRIWRLSTRHSAGIRATLVWGTTITWTLILNVYVPLYDTILVIISLILTARALRTFSPRATLAIFGGIVGSSYVTREIAAATGVQVLTILLVVLGAMQMRLCFRNLDSRTRVMELVDNSRPVRRLAETHGALASAQGRPR